MYYISDKKEQEEIRDKITEFYKYDYIFLRDLDLSTRFKYGIILDESVTLRIEFITILELCINYFNDDSINILVPDIKYINTCKLEGFYPTIHIEKDDFNDKNAILNVLDEYPIGNDWMGCSATNICAYPSSYKWIFTYDKDSETACFASNDKELLVKIKKQYRKMFDDPFIPIDELIKFPYHYARTIEEFYTLPISKLEII